MRPSGRTPEQSRDIRITRHYTRHAEGSVLVEFGDTKVICTASVENKVPPFLRGEGKGAAVDLSALGEHSITIDCDVIQADGGTRTAAITGGCVALIDALNHLVKEGRLKKSPLKQMIAAFSVGVYKGTPVLDLDYPEDSEAETDMNVIMTDQGGFIEIQGTAEGAPFEQEELDGMLKLAKLGIGQLFEAQKAALAD